MRSVSKTSIAQTRLDYESEAPSLLHAGDASGAQAAEAQMQVKTAALLEAGASEGLSVRPKKRSKGSVEWDYFFFLFRIVSIITCMARFQKQGSGQRKNQFPNALQTAFVGVGV